MVTARTRVLKPVEPSEEPGPQEPITFNFNGLAPGLHFDGDALHVEHDDGSLTLDFNPDMSDPDEGRTDFYQNLCSKIEPGELSHIATSLMDGIEHDKLSRKEWIEMRAKGISLLGLKIEEPKGDFGTAPLEGMSTIRHPLLLEATVRFQATARGELMPSGGPVKIRNDATMPPRQLPPQAQGAPPLPPPPAVPSPMGPMGNAPQGAAGIPFPPPQMPPPQPSPNPDMPGMAMPMGQPPGLNGPPPALPTPVPPAGFDNDELATALEIDMNHYLTAVATEYVPDTDRMLFYVGFGGDGFKKVYNCPLRQRPVSESVDAEDLIVSNAATDLQSCGRVTHKIKMRKSVLRRMQICGAYRDVQLLTPNQEQPDAVEEKKNAIQGNQPLMQRTEDRDYTIYEVYCELDLDKFAPDKFKGKGIPLPYRVTIEADSRQVLSVIRNWKEDDDEALPKQFFVQFPFVRGLGFYGLGLVHLLGNTTNTLTASWREMLDAGMFANFPGFLFKKELGRQNSSQIRVPPGGGFGLEVGAMSDIRQAVMPLPYKEPGPSFTAFIQHVEEVGQRLGQTADIQIGEGKQDAPVGTTLALIEQATKIIDSVHKRLHASQAEEFTLLKERFLEDPEAFWRHTKTSKDWERTQFVRALKNNKLVPVADPNNPTSLHRMAKAAAIKQLQQASPLLYDPVGVDTRVLRTMGIDPEGLFRPTPAPPPPDPRMEAIKQKAMQQQGQLQQQAQDAMHKAQVALAQLADKHQDRESRERIEQMKIALETVKLQEERIIHAHEMQNDTNELHHNMQLKAAETGLGLMHDHVARMGELHSENVARQQEMAHDQVNRQQEMAQDAQRHRFDMAVSGQQHQQDMEHEREMQALKLEHQRALTALARKQAAQKPKSSNTKK